MTDWPTVPLGDVTRIVRGISYKSSEINAERVGHPFLNLKSVDRGGGYRPEGLKYFTGRVKAEQFVGPGDLLIANTDLTRDKAILGCPVFLPDHPEVVGACFSLDLSLLKVDSRRVDARFLALTLQSELSRHFMKAHSSGTTVIHLKLGDVPRLVIPMPALQEQRRIVDLIAALDAQIDALFMQCDSLRILVGALREALVVGVAWEPVGTMVGANGIQIGPFGSQLHAHEYSPTGVPVVMPQDLRSGEIDTSKIKCIPEATASRLSRHRLRPGDLILPRRGDLTKRALVKPDQQGWLCGTGCIRIRLADSSLAPALLEGLSNVRTDEWLMTNAVGTTMLNLNTEIVSKLPAPNFSDTEHGLAEASIAARQLIVLTEQERGYLSLVRGRTLTALLAGVLAIPDSYDTFMAEVV